MSYSNQSSTPLIKQIYTPLEIPMIETPRCNSIISTPTNHSPIRTPRSPMNRGGIDVMQRSPTQRLSMSYGSPRSTRHSSLREPEYSRDSLIQSININDHVVRIKIKDVATQTNYLDLKYAHCFELGKFVMIYISTILLTAMLLIAFYIMVINIFHEKVKPKDK